MPNVAFVRLLAISGLTFRLAALAIIGALCIAGFEKLVLRDYLVDDTLYAEEIALAASRYQLPPELVRAVVFQESRFDRFARGSHGEIGLMQVLPRGAVADWSRIGRRPIPDTEALYDAALNLDIGCWYLGRALKKWDKYSNGSELALAQYNAGATRAQKWKPDALSGDVIGRITIKSTRDYVTKIMKRYRGYLSRRATAK